MIPDQMNAILWLINTVMWVGVLSIIWRQIKINQHATSLFEQLGEKTGLLEMDE